MVTDGATIRTAANVDKAWIDTDARALLGARLGGLPVTVLNDADAAGVAEMQFGAGRDRRGTVLLLTFGTGIGSALFADGELVANTELGDLELNGHDAEKRASTKAKEDHELTWSTGPTGCRSTSPMWKCSSRPSSSSSAAASAARPTSSCR